MGEIWGLKARWKWFKQAWRSGTWKDKGASTWQLFNGSWPYLYPEGEEVYYKIRDDEGDLALPVITWNSISHIILGFLCGLIIPFWIVMIFTIAREVYQNWGKRNTLKIGVDILTWSLGALLGSIVGGY